MYTLNQTEISFFRQAGYIKLAWKFEEKVINMITLLLDSILASQASPLKRDINGNIVKIFNLYDRNEEFVNLYSSPLILNPLVSLIGPNIEFLKNRHNHASVILPKANERRFHRDVLHWSRPVISVLIYMQDTNIFNGCTEIIPCSQYLPFTTPSGLPNHAGTWLDEFRVFDGFENQSLPVLMKKGEILIFDSLIFHSPGINSTQESRYAITAAYHGVDELLPVDCNKHRILMCGERVYCGNEYNWGR